MQQSLSNFCQLHTEQHGHQAISVYHNLVLYDAILLWCVWCYVHAALLVDIGQLGAVFQDIITVEVFHLFSFPFYLYRCCFTILAICILFLMCAVHVFLEYWLIHYFALNLNHQLNA